MSLISPVSDNDLPVAIAYTYRISKKSRIVYTSVIAAFIGALISLPFIDIPTSVKASGVLQPETGRYELTVPVQGKIVKVLVSDNQKILKGDTVLLMDTSFAAGQIKSIKERRRLLNELLSDLEALLSYSGKLRFDEPGPILQTGQYDAALRKFLEETRQRENARSQNELTYNRYGYLYKNGVISQAEFDKFKFEHEQSVSGSLFLVRQYRLQWQTDLIALREELRQLQNRQVQLQQEYDLLTIISPYSGSIQNLKPLGRGAYASANEKIAEVSPDGRLKAYCFVKTADIGEISSGQRVSFQIDAFNYTKWGLLTGKVIEISDDIILVKDAPVFRVKCLLDRAYFEQGGNRMYLKKGMGLIARFNTGDYSLFQLLYKQAEGQMEPGSGKRG